MGLSPRTHMDQYVGRLYADNCLFVRAYGNRCLFEGLQIVEPATVPGSGNLLPRKQYPILHVFAKQALIQASR